MRGSPLAIHGGTPVRATPMPPRRLFGERELEAVRAVFEESWRTGVDFGFQGKFESLYTERFCAFQGGGFADAVSSGTGALYAAIGALDIPPGAEVLVSPVTDPGGIAPALLHGLRVTVADAAPGSFNIGPAEFEAALTPRTGLAILTHVGGVPADLDPILEIARARGIPVVEDCSQAHGALYKGQKVGRFGQIAIFSTMFSKIHASGGCGGLVYTRDERLYRRVRSFADRGKNFDRPDFAPKDPRQSLFPALNLNQDELSCAIGASTLERLPQVIERRLRIAERIDEGLRGCSAVRPLALPGCVRPSPFFHTVGVDTDELRVGKVELAKAVAAEGVPINPDYAYVVAEWPWIQNHLARPAHTPNAVLHRDTTFNILFHEEFTPRDVDDIVAAVRKVEAVYAD